MFLDLTPEQRDLQRELREYFAGLLTPEIREKLGGDEGEAGGELYKDLIRQMGADGWLGIGWPTEYGGQGRSPVEQYIFFEEADRAAAPIPLVTLNTVGPTLMLYGNEQQKARFLPAILRGEVHFAIGYTEPGAGTDLASLSTRAVRDGDEYVIDGQKVFTTGAHFSDYVWLAARTDPDAPKHKGLSVFIVDLQTPGVSWTPIHVLDGHRTNATYFEGVRVPASALVGKENEGWKMVTTQLNHERIALASAGRVSRLLEGVVCWAHRTEAPGGGRVIDQPWVQLALARVRAKVDALRLMNFRRAWEMASGAPAAADSAAVKVFGTETYIEAYRLLLEVTSQGGNTQPGSPDAVLEGELDWAYRRATILTFGGGVNEIQRGIVATAGLGLPRESGKAPAP
ncbi:MAG TPA: acyl-CoA dehydrogenase family protein [Actinomycetota bacterium]